MRLLAVGDSFTYGAELSGTLLGKIEPHDKAWPNLLAEKLGYTFTNLARPGSGNTRMIRHAISEVDNYDMIVIGWSHFARIEVADENGFYDLWPGCDGTLHNHHAPWRVHLTNYITEHYNDDYLYRQYLLNIILIQNFLKANNKRYLMLDAFGNHQANQRSITSNQTLLQQIDATYYVGWPDESMMEWTYGTSQGPNNHFLEQGHIQVADIVFNHMKELGWVN